MFTTAVTVEISIPQISSISSSSAQISGIITTYGLQMDEIGICYSTSSMPTVDATKVVLSGNKIEYTLNELTPETAYYVRIYAKLGGEYYYGDQGTFTTSGIIKTHFEPTNIYEGKVELTSVAPSGVKKVDICYGTSPNPKITDNVTTASVGSDGKLRLSLTKLSKGTTYYLRAYSRVGSKIEYYDDEVSVETVGGNDFFVKYTYERYEKMENTNPYSRYRVFLSFTCDIKLTGTYLLETEDNGELKKETDYSQSIYIESGMGTFYYKREDGYESYDWIDFRVEDEIIFTNIENNLRYHFTVPAKYYKGY